MSVCVCVVNRVRRVFQHDENFGKPDVFTLSNAFRGPISASRLAHATLVCSFIRQNDDSVLILQTNGVALFISLKFGIFVIDTSVVSLSHNVSRYGHGVLKTNILACTFRYEITISQYLFMQSNRFSYFNIYFINTFLYVKQIFESQTFLHKRVHQTYTSFPRTYENTTTIYKETETRCTM